jgi:predicted HAD superfamily Cof-like phosphohydrolase
MSYEHYKEARTFRVLMDQGTDNYALKTAALQQHLISEEYEEFLEAHAEATYHLQNKRAREACLKELADLAYVCYQYAAAAGWDLDEALARVHESNLSKLDDNLRPIKREDGKVMKGPNYKKANLIDLV